MAGISPAAIDRFARNVVAGLESGDQPIINELVEKAVDLDLDLQDIATLFRISSGEASDRPPERVTPQGDAVAVIAGTLRRSNACLMAGETLDDMRSRVACEILADLSEAGWRVSAR